MSCLFRRDGGGERIMITKEEIREDIEKRGEIDLEGNISLRGISDLIKVGKIDKEDLNQAVVLQKKMREIYDEIIQILGEYMDIELDTKKLISLWIIGTYMHSDFPTYPYLFFNAMRGSGKSRVLKIIAELSYKGSVLNNVTEAVLFREQGTTYCIDEFEGVASKQNQTIRELLNSAYKKGTKVKRNKKVKNQDGESYEIETFDMYRPICIANIWGMEEVLGDRCITTVLDKSSNESITRMMDIFEFDPKMKAVKSKISAVEAIKCSLCGVVSIQEIYIEWNKYIYTLYNTSSLHYTNNTNYTELYNRINELNINGRNLEIIFPLLILSDFIGKDVLEDFLKISKNIVKERKNEEFVESRDYLVIDFISKQSVNIHDWNGMKELTQKFKQYLLDNEHDHEEDWVHSKWFGKALRRLKLYKDKRRLAKGIEVILNTQKAKEMLNGFHKENQDASINN